MKPENILVCRERAILCDFGVAEMVSEQSYRARGLTPQYASLEMLLANSMDLRGEAF